MSKPRIADVAKLAGVSPSTVTRVLHGNGYVSVANKSKVDTALEVLGYLPNIQARSLRNRRSYTIGLLLSSERTNPYYTNIADAIRAAAGGKGYFVLSVNHGFSSMFEASAVRQFMQYDVEAVIVCNALEASNFAPLRRAGIPIIQVERNRLSGTHQIEVDLRPGFDDGLERLTRLGHSKIAFIGWRPLQEHQYPNKPLTEHIRSEGFREAAMRKGLKASDCPILLGTYDVGRQPSEVGRVLTNHLFEEQSSQVTAIMTGSDVLAAGVLQALNARGMRVPDDISVIGYDDSMAAYLSPPLTTICQPYAAIADAALEILTQLEQGSAHSEPIAVSVVNRLVERNSIAAIDRKR
jgi:LacI family transcriptional regulator